MKINSISNCYQNNANFKGTVDKSVVRYLDEIRYDALNKTNSFFESKKVLTADFEKVKPLIEGIMSKLNEFMAKTHPKTKISLFDFAHNRSIRFENSDLKSFVHGAQFWLNGTEKEYGTRSGCDINLLSSNFFINSS